MCNRVDRPLPLVYITNKCKTIQFFISLASECNRLKLQIEDMRQVQEAKDNTMVKIQDQIQRLFEVIFQNYPIFVDIPL